MSILPGRSRAATPPTPVGGRGRTRRRGDTRRQAAQLAAAASRSIPPHPLARQIVAPTLDELRVTAIYDCSSARAPRAIHRSSSSSGGAAAKRPPSAFQAGAAAPPRIASTMMSRSTVSRGSRAARGRREGRRRARRHGGRGGGLPASERGPPPQIRRLDEELVSSSRARPVGPLRVRCRSRPAPDPATSARPTTVFFALGPGVRPGWRASAATRIARPPSRPR